MGTIRFALLTSAPAFTRDGSAAFLACVLGAACPVVFFAADLAGGSPFITGFFAGAFRRAVASVFAADADRFPTAGSAGAVFADFFAGSTFCLFVATNAGMAAIAFFAAQRFL